MRVRDLDGLDLVMFREGYDLRAVTLSACVEAGVEPHLVSEGAEMAGVLSFVAAGLGAAVVPAIALPGDGSLVGIPFAAPTLSRTVALAQRGDRAWPAPPVPWPSSCWGAADPGSAATDSGGTGLGFVHGWLFRSRPVRDSAARWLKPPPTSPDRSPTCAPRAGSRCPWPRRCGATPPS